jgi:single-strand DNA-binding protein
MNKAILIGRLVADPEQPQSDNAPVSIRLATDDYNFSTKQKEATFHSIKAWGRTKDTILNYASKGRRVMVSGRITYRKWTDKANVDHWSTEIIADEIELLDSPSGSANKAQAQAPDTNW